MVGVIDKRYLYPLIFIFIFITFMQVAEEVFAGGYADTHRDTGILGYLESVPVIGMFIDVMTINIPDTPIYVTIFLNTFNALLWVLAGVYLTNMIVTFLNLDEGILGWLF